MARFLVAPLVALWTLVGPPSVEGEAPGIDQGSFETGIAARVPDAEAWSIRLAPGEEGAIHVTVNGPAGRHAAAELQLEAEDPEGRGRELAAAVTLLIESAPEPEPEPVEPEPVEPEPPPPIEPDPPKPTPPPVRGFVGAGGRLDVGSRPSPGVTVQGGLWVLQQHLEPRVELGWSTSSGDGLRLNHFRFGAGLGAGAPVAGDVLWLGGGVLGQGLHTTARDVSRSTATSFALQGDALLRVRWRHLLVAAEGGPGLVLPPLRVVGSRTRASYGPLIGAVRLSLGAEF